MATVVAMLMLQTLLSHTAFAEAAPTETLIQSTTETAWFDPESQQLRPIHVESRTDDSGNRNSRWLPKPEKVKVKSSNQTSNNTATGANAGASGGGGWTLFGTGLTIGNLFGWLVVVALIAVPVAILVYVLMQAETDGMGRGDSGSTGSKKRDPKKVDQQTIERIKHLPPELRRTDVDMRYEAERLMNEGQFDQAIILLFGHQLLMLDRGGYLRLARGKTNGRYVRETRGVQVESADLLSDTVRAFEKSYFGRHLIDAGTFSRLWKQNEVLERNVSEHAGVAA